MVLGVHASQIESGTFDGVYFHCSVEENLGHLYNLKPGKVLYTWDPLHRTGLVDKHVTKEKHMMWLQDMIACCQKEEKKIRDMAILDKHGVEAAGLSILTRRQAKENIVRAGVDPEKKADERLLKLVEELSAGLRDEVYTVEGKAVIEKTRVVLDLPALALKMKRAGGNPIILSVTEYPKFKDSIEKIPVDFIKDIPEPELKNQYRTFIEKLKVLTEDIDVDALSKMDPKEIIKKFFDPDGELYKNIEVQYY